MVTEFTAVNRTSVVDSAYEVLQAQILNGTLKPGEKLPTEGELTKALGVSRSTLREALNRTAKELQDKTSKTAFDPTFTLQVISAALRVFKEEHRAGKSRSEYVNLLQDSLRSHAARLQAHKNAALSDEEWTIFKDKIKVAGFELSRFEPVVLNGYHYGHLVQAVRR